MAICTIRGLCHVCNSSNVLLLIDKKTGAITCKKCKGKTPKYLLTTQQQERDRDIRTYGFSDKDKIFVGKM